MLTLFLVFILFALLVDTPLTILNGMINIVKSPDILITDYIYVGGLGAAMVNSGIVGAYSIFLMKICNCENKGSNIMAIWLMLGFAFFGKNIVNIQPIILGGFLYSKHQKKPFSNYLAATLLATTLSPAVSQMSHIGLDPAIGLILGVVLGIMLGFVINPISAYVYRAHGGYNLYNVGFAAGIVALIITALFRNAGFEIQPVALWSEGNNFVLAAFLFTISGLLILGGLLLSDDLKKTLSLANYKEDFAIIDDTYTKHGEKAYINMGLLGLCATLLVLFCGGQISGPLIGGIFTIIGFSCVGKSLFNIAPSMIGCALAVISHGWQINTPGNLLTMLFSATLAPISSRFGPFWGILAGFLHLNLTLKLGEMNGGISLYNNGLAGGFVAMVTVPVILAISKKHADSPVD